MARACSSWPETAVRPASICANALVAGCNIGKRSRAELGRPFCGPRGLRIGPPPLVRFLEPWRRYGNMLRFCIDLIQSSCDRGWQPTVLSLDGHVRAGRRGSASWSLDVLRYCRRCLTALLGRAAGPSTGLDWSASAASSADPRQPRPAGLSAARRPARPAGRGSHALGHSPSQPPSHPTITAPDTVANLLWTSSTRIVIPPGSDERQQSPGQTACRQLRYNHNKGGAPQTTTPFDA